MAEKKTAPKGRRVIAKLQFGTRVFFSKVKSGTAYHLGIQPEQGLTPGKGSSLRRGGFRAKSYTLHLRKAAEVGGTKVRSLDFPVDNRVRLREAYVAFAKLDKVAGITTPDGISYYWAEPAPKEGQDGAGAIVQAAIPFVPLNLVELANLLGIDVQALAVWGFKKLLSAI